MKTLLVLSVVVLLLATGCGGTNPFIDPDKVDHLGGNWAGMLDYTPSGGVVTPMSLAFTPLSHYYMSATMTIGATLYVDNFLDQVDDNIVINFPVTGATWDLVLTGKLTSLTKFEGDIIRREAGKDDIPLGTFSSTRA